MVGLRLVKVAVRPATGLILHLDGGVTYLIVMFKKVLDAFKQRVVVVRRDDLDVQRHDRLLAYQPDVHVMNVTHFRDSTAQVSFQLVNVH